MNQTGYLYEGVFFLQPFLLNYLSCLEAVWVVENVWS
jgi:hypothetical protein